MHDDEVGRAADEPPDGAPTFTVGQLNGLIRDVLALTFPDEVWVEGEISSLKRHDGSGHVYFQLVEGDAGGQPDATLSVALYKREKAAVNHSLTTGAGTGIRMVDGVHIRIRGRLDYYPPQGRLQLRMTAIDPAFTLGRLGIERDRVLAALATDGLLDRNRSLPFPAVPVHIGLVTSEGSAAQADFLHELERSGFGWRVSLAATRVQGPGADLEVVAALTALAGAGVDLIAVVRGGGARTDLMTFDSEHVARAIAHLPVPVVTGIGHEIDTSVADLVAALAHKTPTACAADLVDRARTSHDRATRAWAAIAEAAAAQLARADQHTLDRGHRIATRTRGRLALAAGLLDDRGPRLARAARQHLVACGNRLDTAEARATALDPARALARGWSITRTADGRIVRDPAQVAEGTALVTTVAGGELHSRATVPPTPTRTPDPAPAPAAKDPDAPHD